MVSAQLHPVIRYLRRALDPERTAGASDAQLLERFLSNHDERAFEGLLGRHGAMVWGVCRRLALDLQSAEDAFQATFLVLLRKARTIGRREAVGSWLHRVASRIALRARTTAARRAGREQAGVPLQEVPAPAAPPRDWELSGIVAEELSRLPEKYRVPVVLCYLEGQAYDEAARQLGCPKGTLSTRLTRARALLRARLARRGLGLSVGLLVGELSAQAAVPGSLVQATLRAVRLSAAGAAPVLSASASALARGAIQTMFLTKIKTAVVALVLSLVLSGTGLLCHHVFAADGERGEAREMHPCRPRPRDRAAAEERQRQDRVNAQLDRIEKEIKALRAELARPQRRQAAGIWLGFRFEKGKPFFQQVTIVTEQLMKVQNQDIKQLQKQTFVFRWTPLEQDADRNWIFRVKIEDVGMHIEIGQQKISYDSSKKDQGNNPLSEFFGALRGADFTLTLSPRTRKIIQIEGREEFVRKMARTNPLLKPLLEQILSESALEQLWTWPGFSLLPGKNVIPGDVWSSERTLDMGPLGRWDNSHTCTYQGKEGTFARIQVETTGKFRAADSTPGSNAEPSAGLPFRIVESNLDTRGSKGTLWFDPQKGRLDHYELQMRLEGQLTLEIGGQKTSVDFLQTQKTTGKFADSQLGLLGPGIYYDSIENK